MALRCEHCQCWCANENRKWLDEASNLIKYLRILEEHSTKPNETKEQSKKEYPKKNRKKILEIKLKSRRMIKGINTKVISVKKYLELFLNWTREELKNRNQIDDNVKSEAFRANVDRNVTWKGKPTKKDSSVLGTKKQLRTAQDRIKKYYDSQICSSKMKRTNGRSENLKTW